MKIQWWKDQISNTFKGKPPNHHVTLLLAESLETSNLSINWFNRILNERAENLNDPQYNTLEELENYAENTSSSLLYLQLEALGLKNVTTDHVASHIGKAVGISTIIRATPYHVRERRFYLPTQIAAKVRNDFKLSTESVFRTGPSSELSDVVFDVATCANDHLITARSQAPKLSKQAIPGLLNIVFFKFY
ncbi:NADH dehydrogenase (ubiquinone) complex I, assembly factor 6 [Lobulomyces angularis]|nr:NADH dehydrogenase (ubiquinone) complex I, assembly factor 6 [Lobulomyces angularis]